MYVHNKLVGNESEDLLRLREEVCQKSSRIFLWVVLVVAMLNESYDHGGTLMSMRRRLHQIPEGLDNLFADILARTSAEINDPTELYHAIKHTIDTPLANEPHSVDTNTVARYLLNCSRGLVEITKAQPPIIQFIHETVRDYLVEKDGIAKVAPDIADNVEGSSHNTIKIACARCIKKSKIPPSLLECCTNAHDARSMNRMSRELSKSFPFIDYATKRMFQHAELAELHGIPQITFLTHMTVGQRGDSEHNFSRWRRWRNIMERHAARKDKKGVPILYVLAHQNLHHLVEVMAKASFDVNGQGGRYGNALQAACFLGHVETVRILLRHGADANAEGGEHRHALLVAAHSKRSPSTATCIDVLHDHGTIDDPHILHLALCKAVSNGNMRVIQLLLNMGAAAHSPGTNGVPLLCVAVTSGFVDVVKLILNSNVDVDATGSGNSSPLELAVTMQNVELARLLLEKGADVNGVMLPTPLRQAIGSAHQALVALLLEFGADVDVGTKHEGTPLQYACWSGDLASVRLLLEYKADMEYAPWLDPEGISQGRFIYPLLEAIRGQHEDVAHLLISREANVDIPGILYEAVASGRPGVVAALLDKKANTSANSRSDKHILVEAAKLRDADIMKKLLLHGITINIGAEDLSLALFTAVSSGHCNVARLLLEHGADLVKSLEDHSYLDAAAKLSDDGAMLNLLMGFDPDAIYLQKHSGSALRCAAATGQFMNVKLLLEHHAGINDRGGYYGTALQAAASNGHVGIVRYLLSKGADANAQCGHYGNALQAAATRKFRQVAEILLEHSADVNCEGGPQASALHACIAYYNSGLVSLLLDHGAKVSRDMSLYHPAYHGHLHVVELLLKRGAHPDTKQVGTHQEYPLIIAAMEGHLPLVEMLLTYGADPFVRSRASGHTATSARHGYILRAVRRARINRQGSLYNVTSDENDE
ncbi:hypothetical protein LTR05_007467 [Lithohypha guttulata]|uniref:Uncharacterized protein n=1 Tax=Lithohypha guttulata TaxID=1690604 RepID=A0AAN7SV66_9EURO|nr:hypothetical protein LTR05_007467 [Lithohypha guttulata]